MKIQAPHKGYAGVVGGVQFVDGKAETDDPNLISYFRRHGYEVVDGSSDKPLDKRTKAELEAYAAEHSIDLGDASKKADVLAVIAAAEANKPAE